MYLVIILIVLKFTACQNPFHKVPNMVTTETTKKSWYNKYWLTLEPKISDSVLGLEKNISAKTCILSNQESSSFSARVDSEYYFVFCNYVDKMGSLQI